MEIKGFYKMLKREAWDDLSGNWGQMILFNLLAGALLFIIGKLTEWLAGVGTNTFFVTLIADLVGSYLLFGMFALAYRSSQRNSVHFTDGFQSLSIAWKYCVTILIVQLISEIIIYVLVNIGVISLIEGGADRLSYLILALITVAIQIIPLIVFGILCAPFLYLCMRFPKMNVLRMLKLSFRLIKGYKWHYIGFCLSFTGWILLMIVTFGIGSVFLVPFISGSYCNYCMRLVEEYLEANRKPVKSKLEQVYE